MKKLSTILFIFSLLTLSGIKGQDLLQALNGQIDIVVAQDGSGNYTTIAAAINSVAKNKATRTVILVKKGTYHEKIEVENGINKVTLIGEDIDSTVIVYNDYSGSGIIYNGIVSGGNGNPIGTSTSHTLYIDSDEFILMNLTIVNNAGDVGQAVAINLGGDRTILVHCRILGNQDTFYTWGYGRFFMKDCFIEGDVDFIFGRGVALFDSCIINTNRSSCQITAASTDVNWKYGYVFQNCKITANSGVGGVTLGRPWKDYAQTVFMYCNLGSQISSAGWTDWDGRSATCYYAEYNNFGPGATGTRVTWSHQLSGTEAQNYTLTNMFAKDVNPDNFSSNWMPGIHSDEVYKILEANTTLLYLDSLQNNAELKYIKLNDTDLEGFQSNIKIYTIELKDTLTPFPTITTEPLSDKAVVSIELPNQVPGNATLTVTAINGFTVKYTLKFSLVTGIHEKTLPAFDFNILNNPFDEVLHIKTINLIPSESLEIALYNLAGQRVLFKKLENTLAKELISIPTTYIPTGFYICSLMQGNNAIQQKAIKK